jgi:hypothetical protein
MADDKGNSPAPKTPQSTENGTLFRTSLRPRAVPASTATSTATGTAAPSGTPSSSAWQVTNPSQWDNGDRSVLEVGSVLKQRFVLERIVGKGGMGTVFSARDQRKEEAQDRFPFVAVKILNEDFKRHPESLKLLQREARKAQQLAHPNIVTVYDFDRDGANVFLVMELLQGEPLDRVLKQLGTGVMPAAEALRIVKELGKALSYAHEKGVIHLDFKPANAFVNDDGSVKVLDFGIARAQQKDDLPASEQTLFQVGDLGALTPSYATVEMVNGGDPDPRDDIYALACVTYELLAGKHPYGRQSAQFALEYNLVPARPKGLPRSRWQALQRGLALNRSDRTATVAQFVDELTHSGGAWLLPAAIAATLVAAAALVYWQWPAAITAPSAVTVPPAASPAAVAATAPVPADSIAEPAAQLAREQNEVRAIEIEARQRERVLQMAKANEVEAATVILNELREELPASDPFISREGPLAIALAYLRMTDGALQKADYATAGEYVASAGALGPDLRAVKQAKGGLAEINRLDVALRSQRQLGIQDVRARLATIKSAFPNAYSAIERNLASVLEMRIDREQTNKSDSAGGLLAIGMQVFGHLPAFASVSRATPAPAIKTEVTAPVPAAAEKTAVHSSAEQSKSEPVKQEPIRQETKQEPPKVVAEPKIEPVTEPKPKKAKPNVIVTF